MELRARREHGSGIKGLVPLRNGGLLSWSKSAHDVRMWDASGDMLHALVCDAEIDGSLELRDSRLLAWAQDRRLRLWNIDGALLHSTEKHHCYVSGVLELHDGRLLSWAQDHKPRLWSSTGNPIRLLTAHGGQVWGMLELRDGRLFSWASHSDSRVWSSSGDLLRKLRHWGWPYEFFFLQLHDDRFAYWLNAGELHILNVDGPEFVLRPIREHSPYTCGAIELRGGRLVSWASDFNRTSFHPDGTNTTLHEHDYALSLWSPDGLLLNKLEGHTSRINGVVELKNGRLLSWSKDGELRLWTVDGTLQRTLGQHNAEVTGTLALNDDRFVSWSHDSTVRVWNEEGERVASFQGEAPILHCVALQDRQTIVAGDEQGQLMFLSLP